jgi:hypothetical protein
MEMTFSNRFPRSVFVSGTQLDFLGVNQLRMGCGSAVFQSRPVIELVGVSRLLPPPVDSAVDGGGRNAQVLRFAQDHRLKGLSSGQGSKSAGLKIV